MSIARLPAKMSLDFVCIREALEACLTALNDGNESSFTFDFKDAQTPDLTFYIQAQRFSGTSTISIEAQRVTETEHLVLRTQDLKAKVYGWTVPIGKSENPNYSQKWNLKLYSVRTVADELVEALKFLGKVKPDTWISIEPSSLRNSLKDSSLFWTKKDNPELLCQRGYNIHATVEGLAATASP